MNNLDKSELEQNLFNIQKELDAIKVRNVRVELDKAWETSIPRLLCITAITYITMNLILWTIGGPFPPIHAIVPTCGYMLSTLTLRSFKRWWISKEVLRKEQTSRPGYDRKF